MDMKPVGVSILTNGNRCRETLACIDSLLASTSYRPLVIAVFDNGSTDDTVIRLSERVPEKDVFIMVKRSAKDIGCAAGTNASIGMIPQCRFHLHLESDFSLLSPEESGCDREWLNRALDLMISGECDYLYLRRMRNEREGMMHWWSQWMPQVTEVRGEFMRCPNFWWSNNPTLFRADILREKKVLPLDESKDGPKGSAGWSQPELTAARPSNAWIHRWGLFVHERQEGEKYFLTGCEKHGPYGKSGCKYGFWMDRSYKWCQFCDSSKDFHDMAEHESRFRNGNKVQSKKENGMVTIFTVDNGWGLTDFLRIAAGFPGCRKLMMKKGVSPVANASGIEVIPYTEDLSQFADGQHVGLFTRIGPANFEDFKKLVAMGVPMVAHNDFNRDVIQHEKNGYVYQADSWAGHWLKVLTENEGSRKHLLSQGKEVVVVPEVKEPLVTVITPTFRREPKIVKRCIDCLRLQTISDWEQLVCSDGMDEPNIRDMIAAVGDARVTYTHTDTRKPADFGNTVRAAMLKKARGKYVMFCDDDNVILPNYMEVMTTALANFPSRDLAVCRVVHFGPLNESEVGKAPLVLTGIPMKLYHVDSLQVMVKREVMQALGWDTEHGYVADGITLARLGEGREPVEVHEVLGFHL